MEDVIQTSDLTKQYREVTAVDRLSLRVQAGEIYGFLGLNGAGKTTTIRMLLGLVHPTNGSAKALGKEIRRGLDAPWSDVGYLVETPSAYPELTVRENLEAVRRLRPGTKRGAVSQVIERLGLAAYADRRTHTLSLGNAQRLGLAKALMHNPRLLILDEPANGLDPAGIVEIRELLTELSEKQGVTVFMSSHILAEVSRLAHRIGIIHEGRLLQEIGLNELEQNRKRRLIVSTRSAATALAELLKAGYSAVPRDDGVIEMTEARALEAPDEIARRLVEAGIPPTMIRTEEEDLEQYFLRLVGNGRGVVE